MYLVFEKLMLSRDAIANIFSSRDMNNVYIVAYYSSKNYSFVVHMGGKVKFQCNEQGLYVYKLDNIYLEAVKKKNLINTGVEK